MIAKVFDSPLTIRRLRNHLASVRRSGKSYTDVGYCKARYRCVTPRSVCGSFSQRGRSIYSILQRTRARQLTKSNASTRAIYRYPGKWRRTCRVLGVDRAITTPYRPERGNYSMSQDAKDKGQKSSFLLIVPKLLSNQQLPSRNRHSEKLTIQPFDFVQCSFK
jgi:hypothetical protein